MNILVEKMEFLFWVSRFTQLVLVLQSTFHHCRPGQVR